MWKDLREIWAVTEVTRWMWVARERLLGLRFVSWAPRLVPVTQVRTREDSFLENNPEFRGCCEFEMCG